MADNQASTASPVAANDSLAPAVAAPEPVPQSEPLSEDQVVNNAGGFVFKVDDFTLLRRFIVLGSDANNYYVSRQSVDLASAQCVVRLLAAGQGEAVVKEVVDISREGRAPKQASGIVVLAMCARLGDPATSRAALAAVPAVCRTASTLFEWVQRCKELGAAAGITKAESGAVDAAAFTAWLAAASCDADAAADAAPSGGRGGRGGGRGGRGAGGRGGSKDAGGGEALGGLGGRAGKLSWGRAMRRTVARWYLDKTPAAVAYQATKYSQRNGWSHADLLRLAHPDPEEHAAKRRKVAAGTAAAAEAVPVAAEAAATSSASTGADTDSEWVVVGASEGEAAGSELGALAAAMAAAAPATAAGGDAAAAAEAQWVADLKAVFTFLTHGTVPGQDQPPKRKKAAAADEAAAAATEPAAEAAAAAAEPAAEAAAAAEAEAPTAAAPPAPVVLSPVMQYLVDAHRLRKEIRAPPPLKSAAGKDGEEKGGKKKGKRGRKAAESDDEEVPEPELDPEVVAQHEAATAAAVESALTLIRRHRFGHEHVGDTVLLRNPAVWGAFLENGMPLTAMIRNLGRMSELGLLAQPGYQKRVTDRLRNVPALTAARVHPMTLLDAMCTYRNGAGARGKARWQPVAEVTAALEDAFYLAFKNVVPTGKRYLLGLDVSGSMGCTQCSGMASLTARQAASAVLMCLVRTEPWVKTMAFSHQLVEFDVRETERLEEVVERSARIPMGGTDCALPMVYATEKKLPVDVFVVLTDNETWFGKIHPTEALKNYRAAMKMPDAKLVVLAFSVNDFSIADPKDPGMLDVAGLDSAVPRVVADFVRGGL
ncbi:hypothetical protein HXX76_011376 [Chlamydomonas incerta]|uniref:TROVE domain-containing protein n=1 Tax=Chlamydomonas incerta TaxID=51695 RepID=A0A835SN54_CHLIN|nr:hypothetical protein HXX76_011376 [Chlamydomonas incerta]|eukprot:KAG2428671.1 hypothetical protein HXX76_011376 [Chlamydomonas incerta]